MNGDGNGNTIWDRWKSAYKETFTNNRGLRNPEQSVDLTIDDAAIVVVAQLALRVSIVTVSMHLAGANLNATIGLCLVAMTSDILLYGGAALAALIVSRKDRLALMLFGVALVNTLVVITELIISFILPSSSASSSITLIFIFWLMRTVLRLAKFPAIVSTLIIFAVSVGIALSVLLALPDAKQILHTIANQT